MAFLDYATAVDAIGEATPSDVLGLLDAAARPLGAFDLAVYLVDFQGVALQPLGIVRGAEPLDEEPVAGSMAGRSFRSGEPVLAERPEGTRIWVPLVERGERTGVVALTLRDVDDHALEECMRLGRVAGLLIRSLGRVTDLMHVRRRRQDMTLAAGMQWDLLPPLTVRCRYALASGRLEPAYAIAGDVFDYAINEPYLDAAILDGMGHGVHSTLMTTLALGAYRHARRSGAALDDMYGAVDASVAEQYGGDAFVTGAFARLDLAQGALRWTCAGHPAPLHLRDHRVIQQLACQPSVPLGLGGRCREVAEVPLEPGDSILFFTDGVVEGRSADGQEFGVERLAERWEHHAASAHDGDEVLRELVDDVLVFNAQKLRDDASLLLLTWRGPLSQ